MIRNLQNKNNATLEDLIERAKYIDLCDAGLSIIENCLYSSGVLGNLIGYSLRFLELGFKYFYFYRHYLDNYTNLAGTAVLISSEIIRFFGPFMNLTGIIPSYYIVAKREKEVRNI